MNDRALRDVVIGLGGPTTATRASTASTSSSPRRSWRSSASTELPDLEARLGDIVVGYTRRRQPVTRSRPRRAGAMAALLRDALAPNLVQTLEGTPAFVHGGPFANIAHGCNSVLATRAALHLADYVVTEAGFGADLGAEKFVDIMCRTTGLAPVGGGDRRDGARDEVSRRRRGGRPRRPRMSPRSSAAWSTSPGTSTTSASLRAARGGRDQPPRRRHRCRDRAAGRRCRARRRRGRRGDPLRRGRRGRRAARPRGRPAVRRAVRAALHLPRRAPLWEKMRDDRDAHLRRGRDHRRRTAARADRAPAGRRATATSRSASPRRSTPSRPTRSCAARRPATRSTSARSGWRRAPASS